MSALINGGLPIEILLVEDNMEDAELTKDVLNEGRIRNRVHWVEDGDEAMAFLRRQGPYASSPRPDLILLDLNLRRMNGHEVLAAIKQNPQWKRIPVIIMTSSDDEKDIAGAYDQHANCYITKPIDIDKFVEAVRGIEEFWLSIVRLPAA
jgi:two-component system, chemotaxis family, response regulator Rcp1